MIANDAERATDAVLASTKLPETHSKAFDEWQAAAASECPR